MYEFISGELVEKNSAYAVVEANGIGYKLLIPLSLLEKLPLPGSRVRLYVCWVVREMSQNLYGFETASQRNLFEMLITFSGVGPKTGLAILGHFSEESLEGAVHSGNAAALAKVPGIGKKTAEKLIVELRDRFKNNGSASSATHSTKIQDALNALLNLGYSQMNAEKSIRQALKEIPEESTLPCLITAALKCAGRAG